jgi:hypothetical protein
MSRRQTRSAGRQPSGRWYLERRSVPPRVMVLDLSAARLRPTVMMLALQSLAGHGDREGGAATRTTSQKPASRPLEAGRAGHHPPQHRDPVLGRRRLQPAKGSVPQVGQAVRGVAQELHPGQYTSTTH